MNDLLDDDDAPRTERELTLSTGAILGIFFGLVLLCGACFGVGYNMGRKSAPTPLALNDNGSDSLADNGAAKPPAGSSADSTTASAPETTVVTPPPAPKPAPAVRKPPTPPASDEASASGPPPAPTRPAPANPAPAVRTVAPTSLMPSVNASTGPTGSFVVQIAAVSHQDDADLLVGALRSRGYTVSARPSASDNFIHVQIGPFSNKKDAEAMRQRLISDGYNAILK